MGRPRKYARAAVLYNKCAIDSATERRYNVNNNIGGNKKSKRYSVKSSGSYGSFSTIHWGPATAKSLK